MVGPLQGVGGAQAKFVGPWWICEALWDQTPRSPVGPRRAVMFPPVGACWHHEVLTRAGPAPMPCPLVSRSVSCVDLFSC